MLRALFLAAMADDVSSNVCITQQGAWCFGVSAGVRLEDELPALQLQSCK